MEHDVAKYDLVTTWKGGKASQTCCRSCIIGEQIQPSSHYVIDSDEPEMLGGQGLAANPQQLMLAAFNACMTAAFAHEAEQVGIILTYLEIQTCGELMTNISARCRSSADNSSDRLQYVIRVSGNGNIRQFEQIHCRVISASPNRWLLAQNMTIEGDLILI
ncbi:OsmC family peroxiredoxin [Salmonella enterica subsp. salamae]|nr:OsmC family peroxiredoxin [Salmonella enterica subsp. salamae]